MSIEASTLSRRQLLLGAARYSALAALLGGGGWLLLRRAPEQGSQCSTPTACRGCRQLRSCGEPQAVEVRAHDKQREARHG